MRLKTEFVKFPLHFDADRLASELKVFSDTDWQHRPLSPSGYGTIPLVTFQGGNDEDIKVGPMLPTPALLRCPYIQQVLASFNTVIGSSVLRQLSSQRYVENHFDNRNYWLHRVRVHIPIITNPQAIMICNGKAVHMAAGEAWVFDNLLNHEVMNEGDSDRYHLVFSTVGSAKFWELINQGEQNSESENWIPYQPELSPNLITERAILPSVADPSEVDFMLQLLAADLTAPPERGVQIEAFRRVLIQHCQEWRSLWVVYGADDPNGWQHYSQLNQSSLAAAEAVSEELILASNNRAAIELLKVRLEESLDYSNHRGEQLLEVQSNQGEVQVNIAYSNQVMASINSLENTPSNSPINIEIPGLAELSDLTLGDPRICVAILDGVVDLEHPCFAGANLTRLPTLVNDPVKYDGSMSAHGTHVASVIFGQPNSPVQGIAPFCRGLIVPIFSDVHLQLKQLDLSRAIELAVEAGANIINISGGQLTDFGEADDWLQRAVNLCLRNNVLLIAATGNDGCECLHVPAAMKGVLAVGAMDNQGNPFDYSNWGKTFQTQGILAPGQDILGAKPGGGVTKLSGSSFATPIVTGVAALLMSLQKQRQQQIDAQEIRAALLKAALPCSESAENKPQCLAGRLNVTGTLEYLIGGIMSEQVVSSGCGCGGISLPSSEVNSSTFADAMDNQSSTNASSIDSSVSSNSSIKSSLISSVSPSSTSSISGFMNMSNFSPSAQSIMPSQINNTVTASQAPSDLVTVNLIYALGTLGYDFGTEARRDTFKQLMPGVAVEGTMIPANPYDARQMVDYLGEVLSEAKSLIWTLNLELTPIYAVEPAGAFARDVYQVLFEMLSGQIEAEDNENYVERVSIPAILTNRSVKLFSGQIIPVIEPYNVRGLYGWKINHLVNAALETVRSQNTNINEEGIRRSLKSFLNRIYYDFRNLGITSEERAINFATTNAFQAASTFAQAIAAGMELDRITVERSPHCRKDSDCWDVKLRFFDPENDRRARKVFRFTIDVSDLVPVSLGEVRVWSEAGF